MKPVVVDIPYVREFPHPADACYAWLTDYQDDDAERAGAIVQKRRVLEREERRVLLEVENETLGMPMRGQAEVRLYPEELRWEAQGVGRGKGILYKYRLTPLGPDRSRLEVHYTHRTRRLRTRLVLALARPLIRREIARMWDGFADAMARDLAPPASPSSPASA